MEGIRRIDATTAKYSGFADVMEKNQPAILYGFASLLPFFLPWQKDGRADVEFLRREFGDMEVPVVECSSSEGYGEEKRTSMTLREYLDAVHGGNRPPQQDQDEPADEFASEDDTGGKVKVLYLKDWHFQRLRREGGGGGGGGEKGSDAASAAAVETPFFFGDDWLNWWCDRQGQDDYRFVYIGPSGSFTGLHHDVLNSFSWSFNICGSKHWTLFPTEATPDLYDRHGRELALDVRSGCTDPDKFPRLDAAPRFEVRQGPGEAIFVPSGWHHQVVNEGDGRPGGGGLTISVNNNWFNGFNLARVFAFLRSELDAVRSALDHLRDSMSDGTTTTCGRGGREWERQCEVVMRANSALNLTDFARLVVARAWLLLGNALAAGADADADVDAGDDADTASGDENFPPLSGLREATDRGSGGGEGTPASVAAAAAAAPAEALRRHHGGAGTGGSREERWVVLSLQQVGAVLRELSVAPCADHIFLDEGEGEGDNDDGDQQQSRGRNESTAGGVPDWKRDPGDAQVEEWPRAAVDGSLRETLEAVEAYLSGREHSRSPRFTPPSV